MIRFNWKPQGKRLALRIRFDFWLANVADLKRQQSWMSKAELRVEGSLPVGQSSAVGIDLRRKNVDLFEDSRVGQINIDDNSILSNGSISEIEANLQSSPVVVFVVSSTCCCGCRTGEISRPGRSLCVGINWPMSEWKIVEPRR